MCFGVKVKPENLKIRSQHDQDYFNMCIYQTKKKRQFEQDVNSMNQPPIDFGFNNLEIYDWMKKKCDHCNRLYCFIVVLSLLTNGKDLIRNLGDILGKIQRLSITSRSGGIELISKEILVIIKDEYAFASPDPFRWGNEEIRQRQMVHFDLNGIIKDYTARNCCK